MSLRTEKLNNPENKKNERLTDKEIEQAQPIIDALVDMFFQKWLEQRHKETQQ